MNKKEIENIVISIKLNKIVDDTNNISCFVVMETNSEMVDKVFEYLELRDKDKKEIINEFIKMDIGVEKKENDDQNIQMEKMVMILY